MAKTKALEQMTLAEIDAAMEQRNAAVDAIKEELRTFARARDALVAAENAAAKLAAMSPAELEAMKAALEAAV